MQHFQLDFLRGFCILGVMMLPLSQTPNELGTYTQGILIPDPPKPQLPDTSHSLLGEHAAQSYGLSIEQIDWVSQGAWDEDHCATAIYPPAGIWCLPAFNGGYHSWDPDMGEFWSEPSLWPGFGSGLSRANLLFSNAVETYQSGNLAAAYLWLGRSIHMLSDISTPAHVNLDTHLPRDEDSYELWLSEDGHLNTRSWINANPAGSMWIQDFKELPIWEELTGDLQNQLEEASKFYGERESGQVLWELGPVGEDAVIFRLMYLLAEEADNWDSNDVSGEMYPGDLSDPAYLVQIRDTTFPMLILHSAALISYFQAWVLPPLAPNLISPTDGERTPKDQPTFTWTSPGIEAEYRIEIDESIDFDQPLINALLTDITYTPDLALDGGDFYWRVQATTAAGRGDWSPVWQVTIVTEPDAPVLLSPEDDLETCESTPTFTWSALDQALEYELEVDDNDSFNSPDVSAVELSNRYTPIQPLGPGDYHWRVNGRNEFFTGPWSPSWRIVILDVTGVPALVSPWDGALVGEWPPTLTWTHVEGAYSYHLQVDDSPDFLTPLVDLEDVLDTSYTPASLPIGTYYWRVAADGNCGIGEWTTLRSFSKGLQVLIPLILRSD